MATLYYEAGFATNATGLKMTCTVAGNAATIGTGTFAHQTLAAVSAVSGYTAFGVAVKSALDTAGGGPYTVTYSATTHLYTISRAAVNFTLDFSGGTTDTRLAQALGFTSTSHSGAITYTSDVRPYYVMVPTELARSQQLPFVYEPEDIVAEAVSDGGTPYAVAKNTTELWSDWSQTMEAKAACFDASAVSSAPWTWQMFFKHTRGQYPFAVYESALTNSVYKHRAEGAYFKATPVTVDWDAIYNLRFKTRFLGTL